MHIDTTLQRKIIYEVLTDKRENLHQQQEYISIGYVFGLDGNVMNVVFRFLPNTIITQLR